MLKKIILQLFILFLLIPLNLFSQSLTAEQIYKKVSGAVVVIHAYNANNELVKQGSGVVINNKGYVVTNYHVLEGCERLEIIHNNEVIQYVDIIGIDVEKDILILKIDAKYFPLVKIGNMQKVNIGERIYAIGNPLGLENTISEGIVSGLRNDETTGRNFIQITASISPGSSGGAVVNEKGELIGISTLTLNEGQNINFAIPINDVLAVKIGSYSKDESYKDFELFYKAYDADKNGNYQKAINYFTNYLIKYPTDAGAYVNRGVAKSHLENYRGAIPDFNKAIEIDPNLADAYYNRGVAKKKIDDYKGAILDLNKAIEIDPYDADAYNNRGIANASLNNNKIAIKDFNKAIEISPNYFKAYYNRGIANANLNNFKLAIKDFTKAIAINSNYADAYINRGIANATLDNYNEAIKDFTKAIEINPNYAFAYYNRGVVKFALGDKDGACLDWSKASDLGESRASDNIKQYCK